MNYFKFDSRIQMGDRLYPVDFTQDEVKNEPMLFSCSVEAACNLGGPITRAFVRALSGDWRDGIIDTRTHMLMPGWYPCIPGWHQDDVPRTRADGQPNYVNPEYYAEHALALVGAEVCPTEFALGECILPEVPLGSVVSKDWHARVDLLVQNGNLKKVTAEHGRIIYFDWQTWHRGVPSTGQGWRWFGRISRNTHRKITNEVRQQVQVYLVEEPMAGW